MNFNICGSCGKNFTLYLISIKVWPKGDTFLKLGKLSLSLSFSLSLSLYLYTHRSLMWLPQENLDSNKRGDWFQWSWVQIPLRPIFYSYFKESVSDEYHMYQFIPQHSCDYRKKISIQINVATDEGNNRNEIWHWKKRWNWSSCTKLALSTNGTHGLIAQLVRASERSSVVVGSNPTQANFL